jgi:hypothetical protein
MTRISLTKFTLQIATVCSLVALSTGVANAQSVGDKIESKTVLAAHAARNDMLKGIELSKKEQAKVDDIAKRDDAKFMVYEKQQKADAKIEALRVKERVDLRASLIAEHVKTFDKNIADQNKKP